MPAIIFKIGGGRVEGSKPDFCWRLESAYWTIMGNDFMVGVGRSPGDDELGGAAGGG